MPHAFVNGVDLYFETVGGGPPLVFIHELAGDYRSWEPQLRAFARRHTCITFSARGYLPSGVPTDPHVYSQRQSAADVIGLLDHLGIDRAHLVGLSMGGFVTLQAGLDFPRRVRSMTIAGCGSGSEPHRYAEKRAAFRAMSQQVAAEGVLAFVRACETEPTRASFRARDPRGWTEFIVRLAEHDPAGLSLTLHQVQGSRPSLWDFEDALRRTRIPALILCGDQDEPCLQPSLFLARTLADARLAVLPGCGHVLNLEEPALFNAFLRDFLATATP